MIMAGAKCKSEGDGNFSGIRQVCMSALKSLTESAQDVTSNLLKEGRGFNSLVVSWSVMYAREPLHRPKSRAFIRCTRPDMDCALTNRLLSPSNLPWKFSHACTSEIFYFLVLGIVETILKSFPAPPPIYCNMSAFNQTLTEDEIGKIVFLFSLAPKMNKFMSEERQMPLCDTLAFSIADHSLSIAATILRSDAYWTETYIEPSRPEGSGDVIPHTEVSSTKTTSAMEP
ncbi:uncharacterized protein BDR25DRAFT_361684 [Lindgomyces ingoldianus]|uniref:Uncharacterized protein n=1 Tax=Lindgomyces ingoldianus TaxID=673940 RepID=A0ACB6QBU8_9PLEO|nr:uncharacterized protein BDR25DRAFT_361684 [Lindgomyces ingoldianus]KAF2464409.1 hypothetical protein BDR25DRAFT_361684 [Lindgomyces ingoldianus]